jgi:TatD DNase family protein
MLCPLEISSGRSLTTGRALAEAEANIHLAAGCHAHEAKRWRQGFEADLRALAAARTILAVGEIGLDFYYNLSPPKIQHDVFRIQVALARDLGLPILIHSRNAGQDVLQTVRDEGFASGGVFHCFTETWEVATAALDAGFAISLSGIVTFPKAEDLREVARKIPLDRLLVETDAPYIAPVPHRGQRNEPSFLLETARVVAELKRLDLEDLARATTANFRAVFRIERPELNTDRRAGD